MIARVKVLQNILIKMEGEESQSTHIHLKVFPRKNPLINVKTENKKIIIN